MKNEVDPDPLEIARVMTRKQAHALMWFAVETQGQMPGLLRSTSVVCGRLKQLGCLWWVWGVEREGSKCVAQAHWVISDHGRAVAVALAQGAGR